MNKKDKFSILKNFFAGYFNQDWFHDAATPEGIVAIYIRTATAEETEELGEAILEYSRMFTDESELKERLFNDLGCYYRPSSVGLSVRVWLERLAVQLLDRSAATR